MTDRVVQLALALIALLSVSGNSFEEEAVTPGEPPFGSVIIVKLERSLARAASPSLWYFAASTDWIATSSTGRLPASTPRSPTSPVSSYLFG